jgi:eukaryotic-like serine/threonine-protein kinase
LHTRGVIPNHRERSSAVSHLISEKYKVRDFVNGYETRIYLFAVAFQSMSPGTVIGPYEVLSSIGAGGMGEVFKARDTRLGRIVALKVVRSDKADEESRRRFLQEARAVSSLTDPNIVDLHDIVSDNGRDVLVMEYVEGKSLDQLIPKKGLRLNQVFSWSIQIASALATAHRAGIIHRDLKPSNVMVSDTGRVKLLDFGVAKLAKTAAEAGGEQTLTLAAQDKTQDGVVLGTVSYMSPEQAEGGELDERSDIFSFGSLVYEMVTGQKPFRGESALSTLNSIMRDNPKPAIEFGVNLPPDLQKLIDRCLRKDPARRTQHMDDVKLALEELKEESDSGQTSNVTRVEHVGKPARLRLLIWSVAAIVVTLAGIVVFRGSDRPAATPAAPVRAVPLTSYAGNENNPSFSPDGSHIAFAWSGETRDNFDIYVKLVDAGTPLRLTSDPAPDISPVWSPDGRSIAFLREQASNRAAVIVIPPLGGPERMLREINPGSDWAFAGSRLSWSPDSKQLVVMDRQTNTEPTGLFVLSVETRETRRLIMPLGNSLGDANPSVSPDGRSLAFIRSPTYIVSDLYVMPLSPDLKPSGEPVRLTSDNRRVNAPAWTPDGRQIIFASNRNGSFSLWRISPEAHAQVEQIERVGQGAVDLALARRSTGGAFRMAYVDSLAAWRDIHQLSLPDPDASLRRNVKLVSSTRDENSPAYSPDGKKLAYASAGSGSFEIWVSDSSGANAVQLTSFGGPVCDRPAWSPDGKSIAFHARPEGQAEIYVINSEGGQPRRLTKEPAEDVLPSWGHDGRWIYFGSRRSGQHQIWKVPPAGGPAIQVTQNGGITALESPDGRFLYYTKQRGITSLWKAPVAGGPEVEVAKSLFYVSFSVAKNGVYFVAEDVAPGPGLYFMSFDGSTPKRMAAISRASTLAVSPDGQSLAYTQPQPGGQDLMLVDNFR